MNDGQFNMPHQFQRWQRVFKDRISRGTGYPQRRAVWRDADTVRRSAHSAFGNTVSARLVGQLDSFNFGVLGKTYDGKSVESRELSENPVRGTVSVHIERHRTHPATQIQIPDCLLALQIDYRNGLRINGARHGVFAVGRHVNIVHGSTYRNTLDFL